MARDFIGGLLLEQPLEVDEARRASYLLAQQRRNTEDEHKQLIDDAAEKERIYRKTRAEGWVRVPAGVAKKQEDWVNDFSSQARYERDLAVGLVKACVERLHGLEGERAQLQSLISWSARMRLDDRERLAA